MTPFAQLADLPYRLHTPQVRDLAWALLSAPLLESSPWPQRHPLQASEWAAQPARLQVWLEHLDRDSAPLQAWLAQRQVRRLGLYYERLWQFALHAAPGVELLAANLPIRQGGHTLGEFDLLLRDAEGVQHLELAVKFYLGPQSGNSDQPRAWLGPASQDRLDLKLDHMLDHQLPLSSSVQAQALLAAAGISRPHAALWLAGYFFYPWPEGCAAPTGAAAGHLRGAWVYRCDWPACRAAKPQGCWRQLPRLAWLAPARHDPGATPELLEAWLATPTARSHAQLLARLEKNAQGQWREVERLFVLPDHWPQSTPPA